ncbi:MAG TPA: hypothetical protein VF123_06490 [Candidatus Sulfotelmatobacter sp.]
MAFSRWGKHVSGPIFGVISIGFAFAYAHYANNPAATVWLLKLASYVSGGISVLLIFIAQFEVWNQERIEKEEALELANTPAVADWKELENRFRQYVHSGARAHHFHYCSTKENKWDLQGTSLADEDVLQSLCTLAGKRLGKAQNLELTDEIKSAPNHCWRWLYFLKATYSISGKQDWAYSGDGQHIEIICWNLSNLAETSAQACLKCAALES